MSRLSEEEIIQIIEKYKENMSIVKTSTKTGHCKNTVNKYVKQLSCQNKKSRDCPNNVIRVDMEGNTREYEKPSIAAKENNIDPSSICRCINGKLKSAGGFFWRTKEK